MNIFNPIRHSVLGNTGERRWPWVFSMDGPLAYPTAFFGCADNRDVAQHLSEGGVLLAAVPASDEKIGRRFQAKALIGEARHGETCAYDDDLLIVRFRSRASATAFIDRLNLYLERKYNPFVEHGAMTGMRLDGPALTEAIEQTKGHLHCDALEDGRLAVWLDELRLRRGARPVRNVEMALDKTDDDVF